MAKAYFLKELVNNLVYYSTAEEVKGKPIPFVHGADDMGHLALDVKEQAPHIKEIRQLIADRRGGIFEVNYDRYEAEKKRQPSSKIGSGQKGAPRLAEQNFDPFRSTQVPNPAQRASVAGVLASAGGAVASPAAPAVAPAAPSKAPAASAFKPRTGKAGKK